jgi:hypothetical protein
MEEGVIDLESDIKRCDLTMIFEMLSTWWTKRGTSSRRSCSYICGKEASISPSCVGKDPEKVLLPWEVPEEEHPCTLA